VASPHVPAPLAARGPARPGRRARPSRSG
jgi:hypothetical protein